MSLSLLSLLSDRPQSEPLLARQLGVKTAVIAGLVQELLADGVPLELNEQGVALRPGTPAPALVPVRGTLGKALRYAGTVASTQDEIRRWADDPYDPAPHGAVWVAERQLSGRGRRGRTWDTTHGTLVFSVLLAGEHLKLSSLALLPLAVGVALREASGVGGLKWPNDLLAPGGRKLAGILLEADLRGDQVRRAVLGIGINVQSAPEGAASLSEWRPELTRAQVLSDSLAALERWLSAPNAEVLKAWRQHSFTLGREVQMQAAPGQGVAVDISEEGNLIVQDSSGQLHTIHAGDVQLIGRW